MPAVPPLIDPHWKMYQGDDSEMTMEVSDDDTPVDLRLYTNWKCNWSSARPYEVVLQLVVDSSLAESGIIKVRATSTLTAMMPNYGIFDLQATHTVSGSVRTFVRGDTMLIKEAA